jgi:adenine-specific DNA methylase
MRSMLAASAALDRLNLEPAVRARLQLILCGAAEMAGYSSRWDRFYPKAFEATANHRFSLTGFAAEVNLLAPRGRGTLARRLIHSVRAARWGEELHSVRPRALGSQTRKLLDPTDLDRPTVVRGSSTRQLLPDHSIDLVLTDPPYYDDVQYAELGALFLTWAQSIDLIGDSVHVDFRAEVVPNASRGTGTTHYFELLSAVLTETRRTLKPTGRAVLTFHNTEGKAWWALARALGDAGFYVTALAVAHAENETDHAKRGRRSFSRDLVIECLSARLPAAEVVATTEAGDDQSRQLVAAGRAVAELSAELASGVISETRSYKHFGHRYRHHLGDGPSTYIRLGKAP